MVATMPATFPTALPQCGMEDARLAQILNDLQYAAVNYSSDTLRAHHRATKLLRTRSLSPFRPVVIAIQNLPPTGTVPSDVQQDIIAPSQTPTFLVPPPV